MLTGTNPKYTKAYNVRIVLETIRLFGPLSRVEIAHRTELTTQTVSNITRRLIEAGLILEADRLQKSRGAPATLLKLHPDGAFSIGLDLDKDHLTGVLVDLAGNVRQRMAHDLNFPSPPEAMDLMDTTAEALIEREGVSYEQIWGVGVGFPGLLGVPRGSRAANLVSLKALPGWTNIPVADILKERLSLPICLENNATAAAIGERWYGDGQHISTFFYVFLGGGLGGGLIINGQPFEGSTGNAGELGLFPAPFEADETSLYQRPHLGVHFNLPRLYRLLTEHGISVSRPAELEALFEQKNESILAWLETGATHLAPLILAIEYLIDPKAIFFGGRLPDVIIRDLLEQVEATLHALRVEEKTSYPELRLAAAGVDAAALGAATLPLFTSFTPTPRLLMTRSNSAQHDLVPAHRSSVPD